MLGCAREVNWPRKRIMLRLTLRQTIRTPPIMLRTTLLRRPINLKIIRLMNLRNTMPVIPIGKPRTIPPRRTSRPWIGVDGFTAGIVALFVVVEANADGAVATAGPGVEDAPSAVGADVFTALRWIGGRRLAWLR
jgi:hypothetical protein